MSRPPAYPPIADYGLIGNRHTCALVSRGGSIDWCCLPHLESPSVFAAVLDANRGGRWSISLEGASEIQRSYVENSPILDTIFRSDGGVLRLRDFLPIRGGRELELSHSSHTIVRMAECTDGEIRARIEWMPRPNYARDDMRVTREGDTAIARSQHGTFWLAGLSTDHEWSIMGGGAVAELTLRAGDSLPLLSGWGDSPTAPAATLASDYLEATLGWWRDWASSCSIAPEAEPWADAVLRSGMVLELLTNERTGAIAAAPTTSLPEEIGGVRNWDYRFCWVRDSSMITRAFITLGRQQDGADFLSFLERAAQQHRDPSRIQVLYGLNGETRMPEYDLGHLDGYRGSRPVRIGNDAALQRQLDVYGELLQAAFELLRIGATISRDQWTWLRGVADYVCEVWRLPDRGIWEVRGPERHFTYSKLMCWVALDRALRLADLLGWEGDTERWGREREVIRGVIESDGYDATRNTFVQSFGASALDASNLLIPLVGFLKASDPRVQGTIDQIIRCLTTEGLVHRYEPDQAKDGVGGGEGAFGICTFWLADALALSGRVDEARDVFESMLDRSNDLGLYAEEIDPVSGAFLGNFPQAFTHVGLINSAHWVGRAMKSREGKELPAGGESKTEKAGIGGLKTEDTFKA
jgi:pentatricopeptide repeat protein